MLQPEQLGTRIGPQEKALRSVGYRPAISTSDGGYEASVRLRGETFYGWGDTREQAARDLIADLPEPEELRVIQAMRA